MKLKKGYDVLKPKAPIGIIISMVALRSGNCFHINMVPMNQLEEMINMSRTGKMKLVGLPICFSMDKSTGFLHFFPAADRTTEIEVYYHPPVMKM